MKDNFKDIQCYLVKQAKKVSRQTLTMMFLQSAVKWFICAGGLNATNDKITACTFAEIFIKDKTCPVCVYMKKLKGGEKIHRCLECALHEHKKNKYTCANEFVSFFKAWKRKDLRNMKHWAEAFTDRQIELYLSAKNQKV